MNKVTYNIPNINCNHCVHTIETELADVEGVIGVTANSVTNQVDIEFGPPANEEDLKVLLAEINYPVIA